MISTPNPEFRPALPALNRRSPRRPLAALLIAALATGSVFAQETPASQPPPAGEAKPAAPAASASDEAVVLDTYVVTSLRASLTTAQEFKQNASEFVDSIVAQDIGKLPDNTVADALQRVAGIQVSRGAGEASTVVIRGLPNIETTVNGYEVFTGTGRGVALQDIPAEMIAGVDAYKSVGPDKIDGGVAGLIDVRLRRPLDFKEGITAALSAKGSYADQADKNSYSGSVLFSDHLKTDLGDLGVLVDLSYARRRYEDQVVDNYIHFGAAGETFDIATDSSGTPGYYADNFGWQIIPGDRKRTGVSVALQLRTKSGLELYSDTLYTGYKNRHDVNFFIGIPSWGGYRPAAEVTLYPAGYDNWVHDGNGDGQPDRFVHSFIAHDTVTLSSTQAFSDTTDTYQGAVGAIWERDALRLNGEFSYSISTVKTKGIILDTGITSPTQQLAITYNDGDAPTVQASGVDYADVNNYFLTQYYDQWSRAHSDQYAAKLDALYSFKSPILKSVQIGTRASERKVNFHQASPGGTFIWDAASANSIDGLGFVTASEPFLPTSQFNLRHFWTPSADWLLQDANQEKLRSIFGKPAGNPPAELGSTFYDEEKTFALYGLANYHFDVGTRPLDGVVGARLANTDQSLGGYQHPIISDPVTGTTSQNTAIYEETHNDKSRWEVLPTINGRLKLTDQLFFRASVTKTVTRPNFADLNPALSVTAATKTVPGSGSGGNPDLDPIRATNYDASLEYYFGKTSLVSVAGFYRSIDGYVQSYAGYETVGDATYSVTRPRNTKDGYLEGIETSYQQFFDFLPAAFKGLGLQANYTFIQGKSQNPITLQKQNIAQVSKDNYNVILIYERGPITSRLAYNWRGKYIESFGQGGLQPSTVWVQSRGQLDFSASYEIRDGLLITFDATNLTRSRYHDNFGDVPMFSRDVRNYDRTLEVGVRYRY